MSSQSWGSLEKVTGSPPSGITRKAWHGLLDQLIELEGAGALGGIRAIVAERLGQVRTGSADGVSRPSLAGEVIRGGNYAWAGALLAAEIDQKDKP